jgi:adenosine/AMP kinase
MELKLVKIRKPQEINIIIGQTHFIKAVEDIHELMVTSIPGIKFGLAFCEASGPLLVRTTGTKKELIKIAEKNALAVGVGHSFFLVLKDCYPINVLPRLKQVPEVCSIFCATSNPLQVVVVDTNEGRAILGVVDGGSPKGVEKAKDKKERKKFLRMIGYKQ